MNALSVIFVSQYLEDLRNQNPQYPTVPRVAKRSMRSRIAAATAGLRSTFASDGGSVIPELRDYPYGG